MKNVKIGKTKFDLNNVTNLLALISFLTDGVYNTSDEKSFDEDEIKAIEAVRNILNKSK